MKTRKKRQEEQEVVIYKPAALKLKIHKFINPSTIFRISNNLFIEEQYLIKERTKYSPFQSFFDFNKIIRGKVEGDFIKFTMIPIVRQYQLDYNYIIERFLSFGDLKFKLLAQAIARIRDLRKRIPEVRDDFFNIQHVIKKFDTKMPMLIMNDNPQQSTDLETSHKQIYISQAFMNRNGFLNPQEYIMECIQRGNLCFPFFVNTNDKSMYIDRITTKVESIAIAIEGAMQLKASRQSQSESSFKSQPGDLMQARSLQIVQVHKDHNAHVKYEFVQTPFLYCSQYLQSITSPIPQFQLNNRINGLVDQQQYDLLQKLVPVSQNRLKRFQNKVCAFRQLTQNLALKQQQQ